MKFGIVIPCYNEANRLNVQAFTAFANQNPDYQLCFVNDGSRDNTLEVLESLHQTNPDQITVFDCPRNGGKAEAVRQGVQYLYDNTNLNYIGFLDADLSVSLEDFTELAETLARDSSLKIVCGSRVKRLGAEISRNLKRHIIGRTMATLISTLLQMPFYDTQCGAKIFHRSLVPVAFGEKFQSAWLFDVEMFFRMKQYYGLNPSMNMIYEFPLRRWIHMEDSKIGASDLYKIPVHLLRIDFHYQIRPRLQEFRLQLAPQAA